MQPGTLRAITRPKESALVSAFPRMSMMAPEMKSAGLQSVHDRFPWAVALGFKKLGRLITGTHQCMVRVCVGWKRIRSSKASLWVKMYPWAATAVHCARSGCAVGEHTVRGCRFKSLLYGTTAPYCGSDSIPRCSFMANFTQRCRVFIRVETGFGSNGSVKSEL